MIRAMLDTNVCIRVIRNRPDWVAGRFQAEVGDLAISTIVLHELLHGAEKSDRPVYQRERVEEFYTCLDVLDFDFAAAEHAANIKRQLEKQGQVIGPNDLLIAGHARSIGARVITGNLSEFTRVDGLRCEDWLVDGTAS